MSWIIVMGLQTTASQHKCGGKVLPINIDCIWTRCGIDYRICCSCSHVVGPRHPFRKEPDLDYDIESDEEWKEVSSSVFVLKRIPVKVSQIVIRMMKKKAEEGCLKDDEDEN
ncbi:conserved hypothetical protein [Ricinus communis]|uniref:Chromatin assembly factor 1 subunit A dimerization domain-containing protein n=1 Tax=Ricinus communis TaxID=3988 RepID=B9S034_RICCO|nr:conserved hypothetical protein [Ricinus communis]